MLFKQGISRFKVNDEKIIARWTYLYLPSNASSTFGLVYARTILFRAKRHRDNLVQNVISHIYIYDVVSLMSLDAIGLKEST